MAPSVFLVILLAALGFGVARADDLKPSSIVLDPSTGGVVVEYVLNVTLSYSSPSCFARPVVLVSGLFEPTITINKGDTLRIVLHNNIPESYPSVAEGISIHYHGLRMSGPAAWFDGTSYLTLCPIGPGRSYAYQFQVNDPPGTYLWHDHLTGFKGDGLIGPLIVLPPRASRPVPGADLSSFPPATVPDLWEYDGSLVLMVTDWWHAPMNSLLMQLNMPFDSARVTADSGAWYWSGNPQTTLISGKGFYGDCPLFPVNGANPTPPVCSPTNFTVPPGRSAAQPWASANNPGCSHTQYKVEAGKTYRLRIIGGTSLVYVTVCFEGHNVTLIAADGIPVTPVSRSCIDVNSGQRIDVLLKADQPVDNYWILAAPQFRVGSPAGYAVLSYVGAANGTFPATPALQIANYSAWGYAEQQLITMAPEMLKPSPNPAINLYLHEGQTSLAPPQAANKFVLVQISQPLLEANGQLRWALDNVVMARTPPCKPMMQSIVKDPRYLARLAVSPSQVNGTGAGPYVGEATVPTNSKLPVYLSGVSPAPLYPSVGWHIIQLNASTVIDVVVQNNPGNAFNGDYRPNGATRTAQEQHPFHLHGHRFWVLARGNGTFDPAVHAQGLNLVNPAYRDTVTVPAAGWAYVRFVADNPGVWPFHCHILQHVFMGQQLYFVEDAANIAPPPSVQPKCPGPCRYNFAPYNKKYLKDKWGATGYELPPLW